MKKLIVFFALLTIAFCGVITISFEALNPTVNCWLLFVGSVLFVVPFAYFLKDTYSNIIPECPEDGALRIYKEREEQILKHGRSVERDVFYNKKGELLLGALALINDDAGEFPMDWSNEICEKMIKKSHVERLVIAGAFIAAEIDRLEHKQTIAFDKIGCTGDELVFTIYGNFVKGRYISETASAVEVKVTHDAETPTNVGIVDVISKQFLFTNETRKNAGN